jgi:hypothetical protein
MMRRRLGRYGAVAALLALLAGAPALAAGRPLQPGTEVFAVNPARVLEVTWRAPGVMLRAQRQDVGGRFTLTFQDQAGSQPPTCPAEPAFAAVLDQLTSWKLVRTPSPGEIRELWARQPLSTWAEVTIRDNTPLAPFTARVMPVAGAPGEAFVHFDGATYVVDLPHRVFELLAGGCRTLTGAAPVLP